MTFTFGDGEVSLINLFPSMPLGSCVRTPRFQRSCCSSIVLAPWATDQRTDAMSPSYACDPWTTQAKSVYCVGPSVMPIHEASLPLGHLQTYPGPTIKWGREKTAVESKLQILSTHETCHRLLPPPYPQRRCVDVRIAADFPVNV